MSDPYADAFARDYMSSKDFARMHGVDRPTKLRFFGFDTKEARDPTNYKAPPVPKPVVWFVEHQRLPMFVNRSQHEYLLDRFGDGYWLWENRDRILHAPVMCSCSTKKSRDGVMYIVSMSGTMRNSQWDPIGQAEADAMRSKIGDLNFDSKGFRRFTQQCYPELLDRFDSAGGLHELPQVYKPVFVEYLRELRGDMGRHDAPPQPEPSPEPKPEPEPNFEPVMGKPVITVDDIPF